MNIHSHSLIDKPHSKKKKKLQLEDHPLTFSVTTNVPTKLWKQIDKNASLSIQIHVGGPTTHPLSIGSFLLLYAFESQNRIPQMSLASLWRMRSTNCIKILEKRKYSITKSL